MKCFVKAGFPTQPPRDTSDVGVENLKEIKELCMQGNLPVEAEDFVNFDSELATTEDIQSASDITMGGNVSEVIEESDDNEVEDRELTVRTFREALSAVSDVQEFAATKNVPELKKLMQDANEILQRSLVRKSRQCTLKELWGSRN